MVYLYLKENSCSDLQADSVADSDPFIDEIGLKNNNWQQMTLRIWADNRMY